MRLWAHSKKPHVTVWPKHSVTHCSVGSPLRLHVPEFWAHSVWFLTIPCVFSRELSGIPHGKPTKPPCVCYRAPSLGNDVTVWFWPVTVRFWHTVLFPSIVVRRLCSVAKDGGGGGWGENVQWWRWNVMHTYVMLRIHLWRIMCDQIWSCYAC